MTMTATPVPRFTLDLEIGAFTLPYHTLIVRILERVHTNISNTPYHTATPHTHISLPTTIREFAEQISQAMGSADPLAVYIQYFKWIRSTFPSDLSKSLSLLEKCTCALSGDVKYRNDIRFVKLWIEYADAVRTPGEIFSFMQSNKIGAKLSLFWIAWAFVTEKLENFKLTDQIFQKGISKQAEPKDVLQKRYQQFQRRMARHYLNLTADAEDAPRQSETQPAGRGALSSLSASQARGAQRQTGGQGRVHGLGQRNADAVPSTAKSNQTGATFSIFDDAVIPVASDNLINENAQWNHAPSEKARHKENQGVPTFWNDAPLAMSSSARQAPSVAQASCPITFFFDEVEQEEEVEAPVAIFNDDDAHEDLHRGLHDYNGKGAIDLLTKDPLRRHKEQVQDKKKESKRAPEPSKASAIPIFEDVPAAPTPAPVPVTVAPIEVFQDPNEGENDGDLSKMLMGLADTEDVTINTKLAMKDIDSMFCSPPGGMNASMTSLGFSICEDGPTNTMARQDLSAAMNNLSDIQEATDGRTSVFALSTPTR